MTINVNELIAADLVRVETQLDQVVDELVRLHAARKRIIVASKCVHNFVSDNSGMELNSATCKLCKYVVYY